MTFGQRRCRRRAASGLALAALLVAAAAAGALPAGASAARTTGACTDADGVTVLVDYAALGGGVVASCAAWPVADGFDALAKAGFSVTQVLTQPGFVCRIDGKPASDPCQVTPPPDAHWSYFHAQRGGSWSYSGLGAGAYHPERGSVEGWAFGASDEPSQSPPAPPPITPPATTPPVTTPPATTAPPVTTEPPAIQQPTSSGIPSTTPTTTGPASTTPPATTVAAGAPTPGAATATVGEPTDDTASVADPSTPGGSPVGLLVTLGILITLAAGVIGVRVLRARQEP